MRKQLMLSLIGTTIASGCFSSIVMEVHTLLASVDSGLIHHGAQPAASLICEDVELSVSYNAATTILALPPWSEEL